MDLFHFDPAALLSFLLTFLRVSLIIFMLPVFGVDGLPNQWKAAFCLVFTMAVWPLVSLPGEAMPAHPFGVALLIVGELVLGLILGLAVRFFFAGIQAGGELVAMQVGFSMITFADPASGGQTGVIAHLLYTVALLIFLSLDGHLYLLRAFVETFRYIPAGGLLLGDSIFHQMLSLAGMMYALTIKVIAPVMAALFLVELALALMSRAAPQVHIMEVGFPLKIAVGFFFVAMLFNMLSLDIRQYILGLDSLFSNLLRAMSPGLP